MSWLGKLFASRKRRIIAIALVALIPLSFGTYHLVSRFYQAHVPLTAPPAEVKGSIVTLRELKEEHYIDFHNMFSDIVRKNLEFPEHITLNYTIRFLQMEQERINTGEMVAYCIFDNKDNKLIGWIDIKDKNDIDPGQLSCWVNEAYWGGGRLQEALKLITDVYFRVKPHEHDYIAHVRLWNKRSYHALKKFGLQDVGYFYEDGKASRYILEYKRK